MTTRPSGDGAPETSWVLVEPINNRLAAIEHRLAQMEASINALLNTFHIPIPDLFPTTPAQTQTTDQQDLRPRSISDPTNQEPTISKDPSGRYMYSPLATDKSEIRILELRRSDNFDAPVNTALKTISLDDEHGPLTHNYSALSYCWGPPKFSGTICLDGYDFPVTQNLETALRYIRNSGPEWWDNTPGITYWWIDQICINQEDIDERGDQVALMRRIYKRSSKVTVWLGEEADNSSIAMDILNKLGTPPANAPGEKAIQYPTFTDEEVEEHWKALDALFKRPWWERVWIRQEIALSIYVTLMCGDKSCMMEMIGPALAALEYAQDLGYVPPVPRYVDRDGILGDSKIELGHDYHAKQLQALRQSTNNGYTWVGLERMLTSARSCKATDPRDTVFSVIGLCDPEVYPIMADYRIELQTVLASATRAVISQEYGLDILGVSQNPERKHGMPSWVANLGDDWKMMPFSVYNDRGARISQLHVTDTDTARVSVEGECLVLRGGLIDSIASLCENVVSTGSADSDMGTTYTAWKNFVRRAAERQELDEGEAYDFVKDYDPSGRYSKEEECEKNWIRFVTVFSDKALDTSRRSGKKRVLSNHSKGDVISAAEEDFRNYQAAHTHLNLKLCRSLLVPPSHNYRRHPNRRVYAGLKLYGPGRKLCITKRGYIALVPNDVEIGDSIALIPGAAFPYILRKYGGKKRHVLVGECFIPSFATGRGQRLAEDEFRVGLEAILRIY